MGKIRVAVTCSIKPEEIPGEEKEKFAEFDSRRTVNDLAEAIISHGHTVEIINVKDDVREVLEARKDRIDIVFNVAEGLAGEEREAVVPKICEEIGIPFTASGSEASIITLNKAKTKEVLARRNILTPEYRILDRLAGDFAGIKFPLIVKPLLEGSSKGIFNDSLVNNKRELKRAVERVLKQYNQPAIVEEFLPGREFTVGIIGNDNPVVLPIVEVTFEHLPKGIYPMDSYEAKWIYDDPKSGVDPLVCPAKIDAMLEKNIKETALKTYRALNCKDWARIDMRLDKEGNLNVLEINALPGFMKDPAANSRLPRAAYAAGWSYEKLIGEVLNSAIKRWGIGNRAK